MKITKTELAFAVVLAVTGLVFSSKQWLLYLNGLSPIEGLGVYYVLLFIYFSVLAKFGLVIFNFKISQPLQVIGILLITFALFIGINFESQYVQYVTKGNMEVSPVYIQSEDGATFYLWNTILGYDIPASRILTFGVTPFILSIFGGLLAAGKVRV